MTTSARRTATPTARRPSSVEQDVVCAAVGPDVQVGPVTCRRQVGRGSALAQASVLVGLYQAHGSCVGQIDVVHHVHTSIRKGSQKIRDQAVRAGKTLHPDRALTTALPGRWVGVVLHASKPRRHRFPAPVRQPVARPCVVVRRQASSPDQPVDGAAAAKDAAAAPLIRPVQPRRIRLAVVEPGVAGPVLDEDLGAWHREQRRAVLASRLDQQHAGGGILAQPRSHGAAR